MRVRKLPDLSPARVVELQDALLANADLLLNSALAVLDLGNVGLARSLAILAMEESGKAIAIHGRRVVKAGSPGAQRTVRKMRSGVDLGDGCRAYSEKAVPLSSSGTKSMLR